MVLWFDRFALVLHLRCIRRRLASHLRMNERAHFVNFASMLQFPKQLLIILQLRPAVYGYTRARGNGVEGVHSNKRLIRQSFPICKWNAWYVHGVAREQASKEERLFDGNQAIQADQRWSPLPDGFGFRRNHLHEAREVAACAAA